MKWIFTLLILCLLHDTKAQPQWAFLNGETNNLQRGIFGTQGTGSTNYTPGSKSRGARWELNGKIYYFGGDLSLESAYMSDFWSYDIAAAQWTWLTGPTSLNSPGFYGEKGVPTAFNHPSARMGSYTWVKNGKLYLFGGQGFLGANVRLLNDMWEYNPGTNQWTWLGNTSSAGVYGEKGIVATTNLPGARYVGASATLNGRMLMWGGRGVTSTVSPIGQLNDLWEFNPNDTTWVWLSGDSLRNVDAVFGTQDVFSIANKPGGLWYPAVAASGNSLYLFGGDGMIGATQGYLNDVWEMNATTFQWRWLGGTASLNAEPVYGAKGIFGASFNPGARRGASLMVQSGKLIMVGGNSSQLFITPFSDWWEFDLTTRQWRWTGGFIPRGQKGNYGIKGIANPGYYPGSRQYQQYQQAGDKLYLWGGSLTVRDSTCAANNPLCGTAFYNNDFWEYNATSGQWRWLSGSNEKHLHGIYGTQGLATASTLPGNRVQGVQTVYNGKLYMLGGQGLPDTGTTQPPNFRLNMNDMWEYDPANNRWRWLGGGKEGGETGTYGNIGLANASNWPGARYGAVSWQVGSKWYLFGGSTINTASGTFADLWEYDFMTGLWRWLKGPNTQQVAGSYGIRGVPDATNQPPSRLNAMGWALTGKLYLFGGFGQIASGGSLNDLWEYNIATNTWTWIKGSNSANPIGTYGTINTTDPANTPGSRQTGLAFAHNNKLYLFGGQGRGNSTSAGRLNDTWVFDPADTTWTWIKGWSFVNGGGIYGTQGEASEFNVPPARQAFSGGYIGGKMYMMGGSNASFQLLNDVWEYDPSTNNWRWIKGSSAGQQPGVLETAFGTDGPNNTPGGNESGTSWTIGNYLYNFTGRGFGVNSASANDYLRALWRLNLSAAAPLVYTFTGSGNWNVAANWENNAIPPSPLPTGAQIIINGSGPAILNVPQVVSAGASFTVNAGKVLQVNGNLVYQ